MSYLSIPKGHRNIIFQVFCGRWEQANISQHPGKVFELLKNYCWTGLKNQLGITHVYLLGVWDNRGPVVVGMENGVDISDMKDRCPSPFAIVDHTIPNPLLGSIQEFGDLIEVIHQAGLGVLVDFVPNHTGLTHRWMSEHEEYYKRINPDDGVMVFSGDVRELDYSNSELRVEMMHILEQLASLSIDGVRVDMAHLVPISFWTEAIERTTNRNRDFIFIAEAYSDSVFDMSVQTALIESGFEAIYDEALYRNLARVNSGSWLGDIVGHLDFVLNFWPNKWIHYAANHDDVFPGRPKCFDMWQALFLCLPGWHLIYNGSLQGFKGRLSHHMVEILPQSMTQLDVVSSKMSNWMRWLSRYNPQMRDCGLVDRNIQMSAIEGERQIRCNFDIDQNNYSNQDRL